MMLLYFLLYCVPGLLWVLAAHLFIKKGGDEKASLKVIGTSILWPILLVYRVHRARKIGRFLKPHSRLRLIFFNEVKVYE
ncbi:MAG: hypothetical protein EBS24_07620 [Chitinophagia bacterium]|jgi:hypothetical protein|nr:hypothetical protein [Chitinophagia bacterium]